MEKTKLNKRSAILSGAHWWLSENGTAYVYYIGYKDGTRILYCVFGGKREAVGKVPKISMQHFTITRSESGIEFKLYININDIILV